MSEQQEIQAGPVVKVARDLRAIEDMIGRLEARALDLANSALMPGGEAMVNLAGLADMATWMRRDELADGDLAAYEDPDDLWSPFQMLDFWSGSWRAELGQDYDDPNWRPTLATEAAFLRNPDVLAWAWDNEMHWDDFAADVSKARGKLEGVLLEGERPERIRVVCPDCESGRRLIIRYGATEAEDTWKCPACKHHFDADDVQRAYAKQLRSAGAARWVSLPDAIDVLRREGGWRAATIREWARGEDVETEHRGGTRLVWWPDIWRAHLAHRRRREAAKRKVLDLAQRKAYCRAMHGEDCWVRGRGCSEVLAEMTSV